MALIYPDSTTECTNILLIDDSVNDSSLFYTSVNANTFPIMYSRNSTKNDLLTLLQSKFTTIQRIAFVFYTTGPMINTFLDNKPFFRENELTSSENVDFLITLFNDFKVLNVDYLACNTLNYPSWSKYYQLLTNLTGVIVGASNDQTGNIKYGGNWIMESTSENIELTYFSKSIEYYTYLLDGQGSTTFAIKQDGTIWGTGSNSVGQLGIGNTDNQLTLNQMTAIEGKIPKYISYGSNYTIVLMTDGTIWGTGINNSLLNFGHGQLGLGNTSQVTSLTQIMLSGKIAKSIYCGFTHTIVLITDGTIWGTGNNSRGQLGLGDNTRRFTLNQMDTTMLSGKIPKSISCGDAHTIVLMTDGTIWGTGYNAYGQLGIALGNTTDQTRLTLMNTTMLSGTIPKSISCGGFYTIVLMTDGTIWGTGLNDLGQLGIGNTADKSTLNPMDTTMLPQGIIAKSISCGRFYTIVLMTDGTIWGTGNNQFGQLGIGNTTAQTRLTLMNTTMLSGTIPKSISCGINHTIVLITDGTIWGTGDNQFGQLGLGDLTQREILNKMVGNNNNNIKYIPGMTEEDIIATICFPKGTPVLTDQGLIAIDEIDIEIHIINQKRIVDITKTVSKETFLVCFDKDALGIDMPSQETIISPGHQLMYEGLMHPAKWFIEKFSGVKSIPYTGEYLYNVLLEKHDTMNVNNLICETLLPDNPIAKFYTKQCKLSPQNRDIMVNILKGCLERNDIPLYNQILDCC